MSEQLKPCPFCGGQAELTECPDTLRWFIFCCKCNASTTTMIPEKDSVEDKLIERWNSRTISPQWRKCSEEMPEGE